MGKFFSSIRNLQDTSQLETKTKLNNQRLVIPESEIPEKLSIKIKRKSHQGKFWGKSQVLFLSYETPLEIQNPGRKIIYKSSNSYTEFPHQPNQRNPGGVGYGRRKIL